MTAKEQTSLEEEVLRGATPPAAPCGGSLRASEVAPRSPKFRERTPRRVELDFPFCPLAIARSTGRFDKGLRLAPAAGYGARKTRGLDSLACALLFMPSKEIPSQRELLRL